MICCSVTYTSSSNVKYRRAELVSSAYLSQTQKSAAPHIYQKREMNQQLPSPNIKGTCKGPQIDLQKQAFFMENLLPFNLQRLDGQRVDE